MKSKRTKGLPDMLGAYLLIFVPVVLFVAAFLYETYLSFARLLRSPGAGKTGYVSATWEVTNTLLVFAVVMALMLFTKSLDVLAASIFMSTMLAGFALMVRSVCYLYVFYGKKGRKIGFVDWVFAFSHVAAAGLLVITVIKIIIVLATKHPEANLQFIPYFIPGLVFVLGLCAVPFYLLYTTKD